MSFNYNKNIEINGVIKRHTENDKECVPWCIHYTSLINVNNEFLYQNWG